MTQVISIFNNKGGVGKTTTAKMFQKILTSEGNKVLLIDADAQGNLSSQYETAEVEHTLNELLIDDRVLVEDTIMEHDDNTHIIKSNLKLQNADNDLIRQVATYDPVTRLKQKIDGVIKNDVYDYIIVDCPPSLNMIVSNVLAITSKVVIPIKADNYSIDGIKMMITRIDEIKNRCNDNLEISTVFMNCFKNSKVHKEIHNILKLKLDSMSEYYVKDHAIVMRDTFEKTRIEKHDVYNQFEEIVNEVVGEYHD